VTAQEFIDTGLPHSYVLGAATPEERGEVERMAERWTEVREELERLQLELDAYAGMYAFAPSPELREKLIGHVLGQTSAPEATREPTKVVQLDTTGSVPRFWRAIAAGAVLLLGVSGLMNYTTYSRLRETDNQLVALQTEKASIVQQAAQKQGQLDSLQAEYTAYYQQHQATITELSTLFHPTVVALRSENSSGQAVLFWCNRSKTVCIDPGTLANTPKGKQYQLWAMIDGKPVDVGVFDASPANKLQLLRIIPDAQAFAVTLEKEGGVPAPEGPMVVQASL
jgi:anti-sigma-K factor RskA